ncbi:MAG: PASTA domain-containing protein [Bacteroidales bacterium]|nr:PASTA domain-containing protein [Bacteroidales bacterium]
MNNSRAKLIDFLKKHPVLANIFYAFVFILLCIWIFSIVLNVYTQHNKYIYVPDFTGVSIDSLDEFVKDKDVEYVISDSVYDAKKKKGDVYSQDPLQNTKVKSGRKIYLTIVAQTPEKVEMPDVVDLTLRQALSTIERSGLKVGRLDYVQDIAENAVLRQRYKGKDVKPGTMLEAGSKINLTVGSGFGSRTTEVPNAIGKSRLVAISEINEASLNVGNETFENDIKSDDAIVRKQKPAPGTGVNVGVTIDLWYGSVKK